MATLKTFKASVKAGDILRCVENTYIPEQNGTLRHVVWNGATVCFGEVNGKPFRMEWPKAARDVLEVTDTKITYRLRRGDHTVTLERVTA
ncbi:MAG: hypothetical protein Q8R28_18170 [Dehalococcoidia bacterium]|nr:hypothetical protein [Dehalococcoidia bacterium]